MVERRKAWQCTGCGRLDDPRPCVGVCRDQKVEYVLAREHDVAIAALARLARMIASTTPRAGEHERHWLALQREARRILEGLA